MELIKVLSLSLVLFFTTAQSAAFDPLSLFTKKVVVENASKISSTPVKKILEPRSVIELQSMVKKAKDPIAVAGARFSQGGQIAYPDGITIDMKHLNNIIAIDPVTMTITVQTGCRWIDVLCALDPYDLSVTVMQSYADFSVGGALSVNCHGRHVHNDPIVNTVQEIEIVLADGSLVKANPTYNSDLFYGAVGGYGALGIITQATLALTQNVHLERYCKQLTIDEYSDYFFCNIANDTSALLHSAFIYPNDFKNIYSITYHTTDKPVTVKGRIQQQKGPFIKEMLGIQALAHIPGMKNIRPKIDTKLFTNDCVEYRNYELSYTTKSLEMLFRYPTTYILQEYFIPVANIKKFMTHLAQLVDSYDINVINATLRYVAAHNESYMTYAPVDCFAVVLYLNIPNNSWGMKDTKRWTHHIIEATLASGGTYYLPYQLCGTKQQFNTAYPGFKKLMEAKKKYDPNGKFSNNLIKKYSST